MSFDFCVLESTRHCVDMEGGVFFPARGNHRVFNHGIIRPFLSNLFRYSKSHLWEQSPRERSSYPPPKSLYSSDFVTIVSPPKYSPLIHYASVWGFLSPVKVSKDNLSLNKGSPPEIE